MGQPRFHLLSVGHTRIIVQPIPAITHAQELIIPRPGGQTEMADFVRDLVHLRLEM